MQPQEPNIPERRRFLLGDVIVLVAAVALMLSADRAVHWLWATYDPVASYSQHEMIGATLPLGLAGFSLPLLCSVLIRDRKRLTKGVPGLLVHLAVASVLAVRIVGWVVRALLNALFERGPSFHDNRWTVEVIYDLRAFLTKDTVIAIVASWLTLKLVGRWNPEKVWDDRLGRLLGVLWVIYHLGAQLLAFLV